ncbi:LysE family translocator [Rhodoferax fermentans]|uniref:Lysine transporter LysE n=1 Tax=Rhodoferax fermentans TaxID=28066 RepID=A0A1T1AT54_RHOFE|nr:LysE family translocator [Rhodoferax fermentans]MBK1682367.1 LysE family translocator [Rhodoferax fermentans]OOV07193.1 lysine transporter LysE [Rhodoferax fermentans]
MIPSFVMLAAAHFLALLSPGPDFFLVARTAMAAGWRVASGVCLGIALANGVFIVLAFAGVAVLQPGNTLFMLLQLGGCLYLLYMGVMFIRHAGQNPLRQMAASTGRTAAAVRLWWRGAGMGFVSGILNPKNALFYASLATVVGASQSSPAVKIGYGLWMFCVVLLWDILVAAVIGNKRVLSQFSKALPWLERVSGGVLVMLAVGVLVAMTR